MGPIGYLSFTRSEWAALRSNTPLTLSEADVEALRGINQRISVQEVSEVLLPLTRLLNLHVAAARNLGRVKDTFLGRPAGSPPYIIAIAGSVAVGKSTFARILRAILAHWPDHPRVEFVTTDGFLLPNHVLMERGLMKRKGFPESYDLKRMVNFLADVKSGVPEVKAPVYSHHSYDIVPNEWQTVRSPDILIFEGLNVLQTAAVHRHDRQPAVVATVALHPNEAPRLADLDEALREIEALAAEERVRGIGETGLDSFRTGPEGRAAQETSFRAHIAIAKRYGKPLVIHDREAHADVLRILDEEGAPDTVVLHCFSGDAEFAAECVRRGYVLSFAGTVSFRNAGALREAARVTPLDQILVETDAPYLTPTPYRGRPNASYLIPLTVRTLAETTGADLTELCAAISATGERVFGPW